MKKVFIITLTLITSIFLVSCVDKIKVTEEVTVKGITIDYEGFTDDVEDNKKDYYLDRNTDYNLNVYLENENNYNINSIKISGVNYLKKDFSDNSTNQKIVISNNTKNNHGKFDFKIDEVIVNIDNKELLATLNDDLISLFVKARFTPVSFLEEEESGFDSYQLNLVLNDMNSLINFENEDAFMEVFEGDTSVFKKTLKIDLNEIEITKLKLETKYDYKVVAKYDQFDGEGIKTYTLFEGNFETKAPFDVKITKEEETAIHFTYEDLFDVNLKTISLFKSGTKVKDIPLDSKVIKDLDKTTEYEIVFDYEYTYDGKTISGKQIQEAKTFSVEWEDVIRNGRVVKHPNGTNVRIPTYVKQEEEVRGIWVSTVSNIDLGTTKNGVEAYKEEIRVIFDNIKAMKFNTVFFQIRPMNDAFYPSELAPWSRYVTGTEGKDPGFDVLQFALDEAHSRGLELHGWLNPYRVTSNEGMFMSMDENNFAKKNPHLLLKGPGSNDAIATILNPGEKAVQKYIRDVIMEIATNYPAINGIHFDDYFYLSTFGEKENAVDYQTYLDNKLPGQSLADFRRMSVTNMIKDIYEDLTAYNEETGSIIRFGISPSGVWANKGTHPEGSDTRGYQHYSALYADTKLWIEEGYIDYIIPQIYWDFTTSAAPYGHLVDWWSNVVKGTDVDLIIGMGLYRYRENAWYTYELAEQLRYNQNHPEVKGATYFTYKDITILGSSKAKEVLDFIDKNYWTDEARLPWESSLKK